MPALTPLELRIETDGDVPPEVLGELAGFQLADAEAGTTVLRGQVVDAAALWGVLHRLHRAGLRLRSVQRVDPSVTWGVGTRPPGGGDTTGHRVRIDVEGHAAGVVGRVVEWSEVTQSPASTTLEMRLADEDALFEVLGLLEGLALQVRGIRVD